jgi:glyceraldehyde-3-phosphate dehydrogenase (ferredoxin)
MVPNQYWTPGMLSPMPMMGKYFEYYGNDFMPPKVLGRKNVQRMVKELYSENGGICRFHRKWSEKLPPDIINRHYKTAIDLEAHYRRLVKKIFDLQDDGAVFWESARTVDVLASFLEKWERFGLVDDVLDDWLERFRADKWQAARDWWDAMRAGAREELSK